MSLAPLDLLLIDTSALVHWVRQDSTGRHLLQRYDLESRPERPLVSSVTEGEILGLASCWNWGDRKRQFLDTILSELVRFEAGLPAVVDAYAELYFEDQRGGRNTGENDLWIAACARASRAVLLTCDRDISWMAPAWLTVEYVPEIR